MFRESDFEWLSIIACLKQTGMPIKDIKTFIDAGAWREMPPLASVWGSLTGSVSGSWSKSSSSRKRCRSWTTSTGTTKRRGKPAAAPSTIA